MSVLKGVWRDHSLSWWSFRLYILQEQKELLLEFLGAKVTSCPYSTGWNSCFLNWSRIIWVSKSEEFATVLCGILRNDKICSYLPHTTPDVTIVLHFSSTSTFPFFCLLLCIKIFICKQSSCFYKILSRGCVFSLATLPLNCCSQFIFIVCICVGNIHESR